MYEDEHIEELQAKYGIATPSDVAEAATTLAGMENVCIIVGEEML